MSSQGEGLPCFLPKDSSTGNVARKVRRTGNEEKLDNVEKQGLEYQ